MIKCKFFWQHNFLIFENVKFVRLPSVAGEMEIFPHHAEIFSLLKKGKILVKMEKGREKVIEIEEGMCHFLNNVLIVIL